jgi:hypothetical protein
LETTLDLANSQAAKMAAGEIMHLASLLRIKVAEEAIKDFLPGRIVIDRLRPPRAV